MEIRMKCAQRAAGMFLGKHPLAKPVVLIDNNCDYSASSDGHAGH
jgi:hypothetical protein